MPRHIEIATCFAARFAKTSGSRPRERHNCGLEPTSFVGGSNARPLGRSVVNTDSAITLAASGLAFLASLIAASVAIYNARFRRFARERWWERKADTYASISDALSRLSVYYEEELESGLEGTDIPDSRRREIEEHWRTGYDEVRRATAAGAFLISEEAEAALVTFRRDKDKGFHRGDFVGMVNANFTAARTCLRKISVEARKDLRARTA